MEAPRFKPFSNFMNIANVSSKSFFESKILATYVTTEFYAFVNFLIMMVPHRIACKCHITFFTLEIFLTQVFCQKNKIKNILLPKLKFFDRICFKYLNCVRYYLYQSTWAKRDKFKQVLCHLSISCHLLSKIIISTISV